MLTELGKIIVQNMDHFNKEPQNIKKAQSKIGNSISEIKNILRRSQEQTK